MIKRQWQYAFETQFRFNGYLMVTDFLWKTMKKLFTTLHKKAWTSNNDVYHRENSLTFALSKVTVTDVFFPL